MKRTLIKTIALCSLFTCSAAVMAEQSDYKVMIIKPSTSVQPVTDSFNRCALNVKSKNFEQAEAICTKAIALLKQTNEPKLRVRQLTSYAISNRGVSRMLANNDVAGLSDFYEAAQIADSAMVLHNLTHAKERLSL